MSSLSQALHLDDLPLSHSAFQDHAAHTAGWPACLDPTAHEVPVYPRVLPHSSVMLQGAWNVRDTCLCPIRHKHGSRTFPDNACSCPPYRGLTPARVPENTQRVALRVAGRSAEGDAPEGACS